VFIEPSAHNRLGRQPTRAASRLRAGVHMEKLAALLVGKRSPGLAPRDLDEIVDVEDPDADIILLIYLVEPPRF
jgi:hypothetical protein